MQNSLVFCIICLEFFIVWSSSVLDLRPRWPLLGVTRQSNSKLILRLLKIFRTLQNLHRCSVLISALTLINLIHWTRINFGRTPGRRRKWRRPSWIPCTQENANSRPPPLQILYQSLITHTQVAGLINPSKHFCPRPAWPRRFCPKLSVRPLTFSISPLHGSTDMFHLSLKSYFQELREVKHFCTTMESEDIDDIMDIT